MDRKILPQFNSLTQSIRKLFLDHLAENVRAAFTQADSTLFTCAEKAENNQVQEMFFESIRAVRKQHIAIERTFLKSIGLQFDNFLTGKLQATHDAHDKSDAELSLVQTEDFEESLLVTSMSKKVSERCIEALYGIEQRLALINSGTKPGDSSPLSPTFIANSFYEAINTSSFNLQIKTILYMLFEQFVMRELDSFYTQTNALLVEAGVLPNLKYSAARSTPLRAPAAPQAAQDEELANNASNPVHAAPHANESQPAHAAAHSSHDPIQSTAAHQHSAPINSDLQPGSAIDETTRFQAENINTLLSAFHQHANNQALPDGVRSIAAFTRSDATQEYSTAQLLQSLSQLQQSSAERASHHFSVQTVDNIKSALIEQLQAAHADAESHKIASQQTNTIDLVGMLFNFIIEDASLSETSKTILSNLHSLYLQVALQDQSLFTQHQHPARKLLNGMAQAGVLYRGASEESALQQKMQATVVQALRSFKGDSTLFEYLMQDFNTFVSALSQRVELREKRAVEAARGRDKLLAARNQACALVNSAVNQYPAPSVIRNFLEHTWVDVLIFAFLRHGPASSQWQRYAEVAQQLAWSGTYLDKDTDRARFEVIRIALLEDLQKGLELLGSHHPDMIRKLIQNLIACQHAVQAQQTVAAETISTPLPESPLGTMLGEDKNIEPATPIANLSSKAKEIATELEHISFGTWFEFDSPKATLKLSWFSPTTRNYMFVDASGQRVAIKPLTQLAIEIEQGRVRIAEKNRTMPLIDRALNAIQKIFQNFQHSPA